jgi:hypothetical protein
VHLEGGLRFESGFFCPEDDAVFVLPVPAGAGELFLPPSGFRGDEDELERIEVQVPVGETVRVDLSQER